MQLKRNPLEHECMALNVEDQMLFAIFNNFVYAISNIGHIFSTLCYLLQSPFPPVRYSKQILIPQRSHVES